MPIQAGTPEKARPVSYTIHNRIFSSHLVPEDIPVKNFLIHFLLLLHRTLGIHKFYQRCIPMPVYRKMIRNQVFFQIFQIMKENCFSV